MCGRESTNRRKVIGQRAQSSSNHVASSPTPIEWERAGVRVGFPVRGKCTSVLWYVCHVAPHLAKALTKSSTDFKCPAIPN